MLHEMAPVAFVKVEGLGNDFILLDLRDRDPAELDRDVAWARAHAARLCDRRRGIGADGVLLVGPGSGAAAAAMIVVNFDGSRPEMCGNGLRCVAAFVAGQRPRDTAVVVINTDAGPRRCQVSAGPDDTTEVSVEMGAATLLGTQSPQAGGGRRYVGVSLGNPHAVCFVAAAEDPEALARTLGPAVELDAAYAPAKTNVEFARVDRVDGPASIELWVWERGVGITHACGTGACATAVAAAREGLAPTDAPIRVALPGGNLYITVPSDPTAEVVMRGPCRQVFLGTIDDASTSSSSSSTSSSSSSSSS
ncbi:Diaminopimelate epimerase [Enhygromyxa salina]|uniref:Diaminopimelate epimerase n=1 Tax=Enhygromyxa salina TaxID=215803 RepID=A0A0C2CXA3_9BACT|nr:diaminopimelate epimerase [Enhygromyxa salina]KIG12482.1 Diaminopimelate epimerase [Enhygromyxa salina]